MFNQVASALVHHHVLKPMPLGGRAVHSARPLSAAASLGCWALLLALMMAATPSSATRALLTCPSPTTALVKCDGNPECLSFDDVCDGTADCNRMQLSGRSKVLVESEEYLCGHGLNFSTPVTTTKETLSSVVFAPFLARCRRLAVINGALAYAFSTADDGTCRHVYPTRALPSNSTDLFEPSPDPTWTAELLFDPSRGVVFGNLWNTPAGAATRASADASAPAILSSTGISNQQCLEASCGKCLPFDQLCDAVTDCASFARIDLPGGSYLAETDEALCLSWVTEPDHRLNVPDQSFTVMLNTSELSRNSCMKLALLLSGPGAPHSFNLRTGRCTIVNTSHILDVAWRLRTSSDVIANASDETVYYWAPNGIGTEVTITTRCSSDVLCTGHGRIWNITRGNQWRGQECPCDCDSEWAGRQCDVPRRFGFLAESAIFVGHGDSAALQVLPSVDSILIALSTAVSEALGTAVVFRLTRYGAHPTYHNASLRTLFVDGTGPRLNSEFVSFVIEFVPAIRDAVSSALSALGLVMEGVVGVEAVSAQVVVHGCSFEAFTYGQVWDFTNVRCTFPSPYTEISVSVQVGTFDSLRLQLDDGSEVAVNCTRTSTSAFVDPNCNITACHLRVPRQYVSRVQGLAVDWTPTVPLSFSPATCPFTVVISGAEVPPVLADSLDDLDFSFESAQQSERSIALIGCIICGGIAVLTAVLGARLYVMFAADRKRLTAEIKRVTEQHFPLPIPTEEELVAEATNELVEFDREKQRREAQLQGLLETDEKDPFALAKERGMSAHDIVREQDRLAAARELEAKARHEVLVKEGKQRGRERAATLHVHRARILWMLTRFRINRTFMLARDGSSRQRESCLLISVCCFATVCAVVASGMYIALDTLSDSAMRVVAYEYATAECADSLSAPVPLITFRFPPLVEGQSEVCPSVPTVGARSAPIYGRAMCTAEGVKMRLGNTEQRCRDSPVELTVPYEANGTRGGTTGCGIAPQPIIDILPPASQQSYTYVVCLNRTEAVGSWWSTLAHWVDTTSSIRSIPVVTTGTPTDLLPSSPDGRDVYTQLSRSALDVRMSTSFSDRRLLSATTPLEMPAAALEDRSGYNPSNIIGQTSKFKESVVDPLPVLAAAELVMRSYDTPRAPQETLAPADPSFSVAAGPDAPAGATFADFNGSLIERYNRASWNSVQRTGQVFSAVPGGPWDLSRRFGEQDASGITISVWVKLNAYSQGFVWAIVDAWEHIDGSSPLLDALQVRLGSGSDTWFSNASASTVYASLYVDGRRQTVVFAHTPRGQGRVESLTYDVRTFDAEYVFNGQWQRLSVVLARDPLSGGISRGRLHINGFSSYEQPGWSSCDVAKFDPLETQRRGAPSYVTSRAEIVFDVPTVVMGRLHGAVGRLEVTDRPQRNLELLHGGSQAVKDFYDPGHAARLPLAIVFTVLTVFAMVFILYRTRADLELLQKETVGHARRRVQHCLENLQAAATVRRFQRLQRQRSQREARRDERVAELDALRKRHRATELGRVVWEDEPNVLRRVKQARAASQALSEGEKRRMHILQQLDDERVGNGNRRGSESLHSDPFASSHFSERRLSGVGASTRHATLSAVLADDLPADVPAESILRVMRTTPSILARVIYECVATSAMDPERALRLLYEIVYDEYLRTSGTGQEEPIDVSPPAEDASLYDVRRYRDAVERATTRRWNAAADDMRDMAVFTSPSSTYGGVAKDLVAKPGFLQEAARRRDSFPAKFHTEAAQCVEEVQPTSARWPKMSLYTIILATLVGSQMAAVVAFTWPAPDEYLYFLQRATEVLLFDLPALFPGTISPFGSMMIRVSITVLLSSIVIPGIVPEISRFASFVARYSTEFNQQDVPGDRDVPLSADEESQVYESALAKLKDESRTFSVKRCEVVLMQPELRGLLNIFAHRVPRSHAEDLGQPMLYDGDVLRTMLKNPTQPSAADEAAQALAVVTSSSRRSSGVPTKGPTAGRSASAITGISEGQACASDERVEPILDDEDRLCYQDDTESDSEAEFAARHGIDLDAAETASVATTAVSRRTEQAPRRKDAGLFRQKYEDHRAPAAAADDSKRIVHEQIDELVHDDDPDCTEFRRELLTGVLRWRDATSDAAIAELLRQSGKRLDKSEPRLHRVDQVDLQSRVTGGKPLTFEAQSGYYPPRLERVRCCVRDCGRRCNVATGVMYYDADAPLFAVCSNHVHTSRVQLALCTLMRFVQQFRDRGIQAMLIRPCLFILVLVAVPFTYQAQRVLTCDPLLECQPNIPCWNTYTPQAYVFAVLVIIDFVVYVAFLPFGLFIALYNRKRTIANRVFYRNLESLTPEDLERRRDARERRRAAFEKRLDYVKSRYGLGADTTFNEDSDDDKPHVPIMEWSEFVTHDSSPLSLLYHSVVFDWITWTPIVLIWSVLNVVAAGVSSTGSLVRQITIMVVTLVMVLMTCTASFAPRGPTLFAYRFAFWHPLAIATLSLYRDWELRENGEPGLSGIVAIIVTCLYVVIVVGVATAGFVGRYVATRGDHNVASAYFLARGLPTVSGSAFMKPDGLVYE